MTTETKQALRAALETPAFAGVREALRVEAENTEGIAHSFAPKTGKWEPEVYWTNDGWQAAWREMCQPYVWGVVGGTHWAARCFNNSIQFIAQNRYNDGDWREELVGKALAAELRDYALEELCKK